MWKRITSLVTAVALLAMPLPWDPTSRSSAAAGFQEISALTVPIINASVMPFWNPWFVSDTYSFFRTFKQYGNQGKGVTWSAEDDGPDYDGVSIVNGRFWGRIYVNEIPELKLLAESGQGRVMLRFGKLDSTEDDEAAIALKINNSTQWYRECGTDDDDFVNESSGWRSFGPNDVIEVYTYTPGADTKVDDIQLFFADIDVPTYNGNTFTHNGTVRHNDLLGKDELFLKSGQQFNMQLNFSEKVFPIDATSQSESKDGKFNLFQTDLYTNPGSDGFTPSTYRLKNTDSVYSSFGPSELRRNDHSRSTFNMTYKVEDNDTTYNTPLNPEKLSVELKNKINGAGFTDAAGNPMYDIGSIGTVPFANNDLPGGTYRTIIDARSPEYSKVKNGVQPDLLTGLVLNKGDKVDFILNFNEMIISHYDLSGLVLKFNNGLEAKYKSGQDTDTWVFEANIPDGTSMDTSKLEVTALQHSSKPSDGSVLKDYAGNFLVDSVKSITWANLSVDNGKPDFKYSFSGGESTGEKYRKSGDITVHAEDPLLAGQPSQGIFGPNGSGDGLFYYLWTESPDDPFASKAVDNFAAIKRYSLATKQPFEELYPGEFESLVLSVANNHETIEMPVEAKTAPKNSQNWYLHTWTADKTWDSARQMMQYAKGKAQLDTYKASHPEATVFDVEKYFKDEVLKTLGQYDQVGQWPLSDFTQDDSNWTHKVAVLKLDNLKPEASIGNIVDNNSDEVEATITASDSISTVDELYYQFVYEGEEVAENGWALLEATGKTITTKISAKNNPMIKKSGNYFIHVKAVDQAGNEVLAEPVKVRVLKIVTSYSINKAGYVRHDDLDFNISGLPIGEVSYAYTASSARPTDWTNITAKETSGSTDPAEPPTAGVYRLNKDYSKNGTWFVHFRVKQGDRERYYYYYKEYQFDHLPPVATFSSQGFLYPLPEQETDVTVTDSMVDAAGVLDSNIKIQWVKVESGKEEVAPTAESEGWKAITAGRKVKLAVDSKAKDGDYRLYVYAKDSLGNGKVYNISDLFAVYYQSKEKPEGTAKLIKIVNDAELGQVAVMNVDVDVPNKMGYTYSVSTNGGENWTKWRTYTNYISASVDSDKPEEVLKGLRVKFKGLYGNISEAYTPVEALVDDNAYAIASLSTIEPVLGGEKVSEGGANAGLDIEFTLTSGKEVKATKRNIEVPEVITPNKVFRIYQNGNYNFEVKDSEGVVKDISIVVSNFDTTAPVASVRYNVTKTTNGNVLATLITSEPVRILNEDIDSKAKQFTENGTYTFEFEDAVGLKGTATATVTNIDKEAPKVDLIYLYNHPDTRALIDYSGKKVVVDVAGEGFDESGKRVVYGSPTESNVLLANRMTVEVVNKDNPNEAKAFKVVRNTSGSTDSSLDVRKNGIVSFVVEDEAGNTTTIESKELTKILSADPEIKEVVLNYVDDEGNPIDPSKVVTIDGKEYIKGKVQVTLLADEDPATGNTLEVGNTPLSEFKKIYSKNGKVSLGVSDKLGNTSYVNLDIQGIDGISPKLELNRAYASIVKNQKDFDFKKDLGGYTVSDNVSSEEDIEVYLSEMIITSSGVNFEPVDLSKTGRHNFAYLAKDQVGNIGITHQTVYILENGGMKLYANGMLLTEKSDQTAIMKSSKVTLDIQDFDKMTGSGGTTLTNSLATYSLAYYPGLYREGQMKYIGEKLTLADLLKKEFVVEFPKAGWYTIVLQNQERETLYVTILISKK